MTAPASAAAAATAVVPAVTTVVLTTPGYDIMSMESLALLIIVAGIAATFIFNVFFKNSGNNLPRISLIGTVVEMFIGLSIFIGGILYDLSPENPWPDRFVNVPYKIHAGLLAIGILIWAGAVIYQQLVIKKLFGILMENPDHESHKYLNVPIFNGFTYAVFALSGISAIFSSAVGIMGIFGLSENIGLYYRAFIGVSILPLIFALAVRMANLHTMVIVLNGLEAAESVSKV